MATTGHEQEIIDVAGLKASLKKGGNKAVYNEAICSTAGATAAKVTNTTPPSFSLVSGATIIVKFTYAISVSNATLKVGDADAKPIYYQGAALAANMVNAGDRLLLRYDGTNFNVIGSLGAIYESKQASQGGTDVSLVTTGEKYAWNLKQDAITFNTAYNASTNKAATMSDITKANVGLGNVGNFKAVSTEASQGLTDTEKSNARANIGAGTSSFSGNYNDLSNKPTIPAAQVQSDWNATTGIGVILNKPSSLPASDVSAWAKASTKPTYIASEVMSISAVAISANTSSSCSITGSDNAGKAQTIIYTNSGSSDVTVTVPTTYSTPDGAAIELTCKAGGYCEVSYLNIGGTIYARGL